MLNIFQFVAEKKIDIDLPILTLFNEIHTSKKEHVLITDDVIHLLGYGGRSTDKMNRKRTVFRKKLLSTDPSDAEHKSYTFDEYVASGRDPGPIIPRYTKQAHFTEVRPQLLMRIFMSVETVNGDRIRRHFCQVQALIIEYMRYTCEYLGEQYADALKKLAELQHLREYSRAIAVAVCETKSNAATSIGCVYFITDNPDNNVARIVKIGSTNHLLTRIAELQIGNPNKLRVIARIFCQHYLAVEHMIHKQMAENHVRGEWYSLTDSHIQDIRSAWE